MLSLMRCIHQGGSSHSHVGKSGGKDRSINPDGVCYCQSEANRISSSPDNPATNLRHDGIVTATATSHTTSELLSTLPGAIISNECTQPLPCSGDITYYDPSIGIGACGGPVHQPTDSVVAISYGMMGTLSSGIEVNPLCGRQVQIKNPANGKTARGMVVDKCNGCVSTWVFGH